ncbi:DsbA family oxidoreductase [Flaviflexus huanghaiensis]|uniref:DsbA family oxidoreductase n=1 Tax=Flaviflexus huanghaiensis TaxID=1111473 RepID=UPI0015FC05D5|nr:DsbA family oxidoreductase [Flaviflexus huanghaiensis]
MSNDLSIDLWTDLVCPFCYIGEARLQHALKEEGVTAEIHIRSFELDPGIKEPVSSIDRLVQSKGMPREDVERMEGQLKEMAEGEGLTYSTDRLMGTTVPVHLLAQYANRQSLETGEKFFREIQAAYFAGEINPFDDGELVDFAERCGLDRDGAAGALKDRELLNVVRGDQQIAHKLAVSGVPYILLNKKLAIPGAVAPERFRDAIRQAVAL